MEATQEKCGKDDARARTHIRWMIRCDMPEVMAIEQVSFRDAWVEEDFLKYLRQINSNRISMVAQDGEKVVAFFIYELHEKHLLLTNVAVHPDYRGQGIGQAIVAKLQSKLSSGCRTKIVTLIPESCKKTRSFFEKYGFDVRLTECKGKTTYKPILKAMTTKDVREVQQIENDFMAHYGKEPRDIATMIANGTRYGIVAREKSDGELLGYSLYTRELSGIDVNGEFGIIVKQECRRQGIGRKLMMELVGQKLPITVSDIYLPCEEQVKFLKTMGVAVPKLKKYATVKWEPAAKKLLARASSSQ